MLLSVLFTCICEMGGGSSAEKKEADGTKSAEAISSGNISKDKSPQSQVQTPAATEVEEEGVDRSEIERNKNGCEEPSSADPELWNIDNCEVDILVKYKMGGQMWYVQSRMRENTAKTPPKPIPGYPMNKKAHDAKRYYSNDDVEFNRDSSNFCDAAGWKKIEMANPPRSVN